MSLGGCRTRQLYRNHHREDRPLAEFALHLHVPSQQRGQLARQRQAQPGAPQALLNGRIHLGEVVEDVGQVLRGDTDAGVGHGQAHLVRAVRAHGHAHLALERELQGVGDEVAQDLRELAVIGVQPRDALGLLEHQGQLRVGQDGAEHAAQGGEQVHHLEPSGRDVHPPGFDLRQVQQVVDHVGELLAGALDEQDLALLLIRERAVHAIEQQPRDAQRRPDGGAELVAHVGEKAALELRGLQQLLGLLVQLGIQRDDPAVGLLDLFAQRLDFLAQRLGLLAAAQQLGFDILSQGSLPV